MLTKAQLINRLTAAKDAANTALLSASVEARDLAGIVEDAGTRALYFGAVNDLAEAVAGIEMVLEGF